MNRSPHNSGVTGPPLYLDYEQALENILQMKGTYAVLSVKFVSRPVLLNLKIDNKKA